MIEHAVTHDMEVPDRAYLCARCWVPNRGPFYGGRARCSRCHAWNRLPDRSRLPPSTDVFEMPPDNPARLQQLRAQDGRPRLVPPTLQVVLGGTSVQRRRFQEAFLVWRTLYVRSQLGDVPAHDELMMLTLLLVQLPVDASLEDALLESALDAAVLPRHRQEILGRLSRAAIAGGHRARAQRYLAWMMPWPPELDMDSELRLSIAAFATLDRDAQRVLALLGAEKDDIPIVDSMTPLASVFRANAWEMFGDVDTAAQVLRELPETGLLAPICGAFPSLDLCRDAGPVYVAATTQEGARHAAPSTGNVGMMAGVILVFTGLIQVPLVFMFGRVQVVNLVAGLALVIAGVAIATLARARGRHAAWLRVHGPARARDARRRRGARAGRPRQPARGDLRGVMPRWRPKTTG